MCEHKWGLVGWTHDIFGRSNTIVLFCEKCGKSIKTRPKFEIFKDD
jgi:hypothetical protein